MSFKVDTVPAPIQESDRFDDTMVINRWRTMVAAAGNEDSATGCPESKNNRVASPGKGLQVLTVGAFDDKNTLSWATSSPFEHVVLFQLREPISSKPSADFNLVVRDPDGVKVAESLSKDNTHELVDFTTARSGTYTIQIILTT